MSISVPFSLPYLLLLITCEGDYASWEDLLLYSLSVFRAWVSVYTSALSDRLGKSLSKCLPSSANGLEPVIIPLCQLPRLCLLLPFTQCNREHMFLGL